MSTQNFSGSRARPSAQESIPGGALAAIREQVAAAYEEQGAPFAELARTVKDAVMDHGARLQGIEQIVAKGQIEGTYSAGRAAPAMSSVVQEAIVNDTSFAHLKAWNHGSARLSLSGLSIRAALVNDPYDPAPSTNTNIPSQPERWGLVGPTILQPRLLNFLRTRPVSADSIEYIQMETTGDVDYQMGEGAEKAEVEFEGTDRRAHIATIAGHTTASRQVLSDHSALGGVIDGVLRAKLVSKLGYEIINGQGGSGDKLRIEGLLKQGLIMALPTAATFADRIGEATVRQSNMGFQPGLIVVNPLTWFTEIGTAKTETEKTYLFGSPSNPIPPALWNLPVALEPALPQGYALVLDLNYITVLDRERADILLSNSHKDYFTRNLVLILGELRAGLEVLDVGSILVVEPSSE